MSVNDDTYDSPEDVAAYRAMIADLADNLTNTPGAELPEVLVEATWGHDAGMCIVRAATDGSKRPLGNWKGHQAARPSRETVVGWFAGGHEGIGVLTGTVSGNLEMLELEGRAVEEGVLEQFLELVTNHGADEIWNRIIDGWSEWTPSGGCHVYYRIDGPMPGNTKLAMDPAIGTLAETRGEGGFSIIAPSSGGTHPNGRPWVRERGGPSTVATITEAERELIHDLLRTFDRTPVKASPPPREATDRPRPDFKGDSWMDRVLDHVRRTHSWASILGGEGYVHVKTVGTEEFWKHPNATAEHSLTINATGTNRLINFSTSLSHLFEPYDGVGKPTSYDELDAIAAFKHGGDRMAAARALDPGHRDEWIAKRREEDIAAVINMTTRRPVTEEFEDGYEWPSDGPYEAEEEPTSGPTEEPKATETPKTSKAEEEPEKGPVHLPDSFYESRAVLRHISQAARYDMSPRDAVFGATLARAIYLTPHNVQPPEVVDKFGSLNSIVCLLGESGTGKGKAMNTAKRLLPERPISGYQHAQITAGTGEGLGAAYWAEEEIVDENGKTQGKEWRRRLYGILQRVDEGEENIKLGQRNGATLWTQMRAAWSGQQLGFTNASKDAKRPTTDQLTYRYCMIIGFQPGTVGPLLDDQAGGTPQRFLWFKTTDPTAELVDDDPGELPWDPKPWEYGPEHVFYDDELGVTRRLMSIDYEVREEFRTIQLEVLRGERGGLDGHAAYVRLKLASGLAILDQRYHVNADDWALAAVAMGVSNNVRGEIVEAAAQAAQQRARDRQAQQVSTEVAKEAAINAAQAQRLDRIGSSILKWVQADGALARKDIRQHLRHDDRNALDEVLERLVEEGSLVKVEAGRGVKYKAA